MLFIRFKNTFRFYKEFIYLKKCLKIIKKYNKIRNKYVKNK